MATVYEARDERSGLPVAVKVVETAIFAAPEARARFEREARAALSLWHPSIVRLLDAGLDAEPPYLVFELLPGGSLATVLREQGALPPERVVAIGTALAAGLAAIHSLGLVHRDLKPGNVLLDAEGRAKIADFGLVRGAALGPTALTATGEILGTPEYASPEQVQGDAPITAAADLYALGATLYALLTGSPPFAGSGWDVMKRHLLDAPAPPSAAARGVPPALDALVLRLLAKDPAKRGTASDVARLLGKLAAPRARSRAKVWAPLLGTTIVLLAALGVALAARRHPAPLAPPPPIATPATATSTAPPDRGVWTRTWRSARVLWRDRGGARCVARVAGGAALSGSNEGGLTLWDAATGEATGTVDGPVAEEAFADVAVSRFLLLPKDSPPVVVYRSGKKIELPPSKRAALSPAGDSVALVTTEGLSVYDLADRVTLRWRQQNAGVPDEDRLRFLDGGKQLLVAWRKYVAVLDAATGETTMSTELPEATTIRDVDAPADERSVYLATDTGVFAWSRSPEPASRIVAGKGAYRLSVSPDGADLVVAWKASRKVEHFAASGPLRGRFPGIHPTLHGLAWLEGGTVIGAQADGRLVTWSAATHEYLVSRRETHSPTEVYDLAVRSGDRDFCISANRNGTVSRWRCSSEPPDRVLAKTPRPPRALALVGSSLLVTEEVEISTDGDGDISIMGLAPDCTALAAVSSVASLRARESETKECLLLYRREPARRDDPPVVLGANEGPAWFVGADAQGARALAAGRHHKRHSFASVYDIAERRKIWGVDLEGRASAAALSPDGELVLVGFENGDLLAFDVEGAPGTSAAWARHDMGCVMAVEWLPGTRRFVASSRENHELTIHDGATGETLCHLSLADEDRLGDVGMCIRAVDAGCFFVGTLRGQIRRYEAK